jgi:Bifunctional DNA primase/polymerase, N-terminal
VRLLADGFVPTPCDGKRALLDDWASFHAPSEHQIKGWSKTHPRCQNTGLLTRNTPAFDIDILDEGAAQAVEDLATAWFEEHGQILVRIGKAPKRCIPFRADDPFPKIAVSFVEGGKIEMLGDGQQFVAFGIHPDTGRPYGWGDKSPLDVKRYELPYIHHWEARELVRSAVKLLVDHFGYRLPPKPEPTRFIPSAAHPVNSSRYASSALERACAAIRGAANGDQESTLNRESFSIGQLVGAGILDRATAINRITAAAQSMPSYDPRRPWTPREVLAKVNRAFGQGLSRPRHPVRRVG